VFSSLSVVSTSSALTLLLIARFLSASLYLLLFRNHVVPHARYILSGSSGGKTFEGISWSQELSLSFGLVKYLSSTSTGLQSLTHRIPLPFSTTQGSLSRRSIMYSFVAVTRLEFVFATLGVHLVPC
jgi:hypothetical protein